jgi:hypothetical protein
MLKPILIGSFDCAEAGGLVATPAEIASAAPAIQAQARNFKLWNIQVSQG